MVEMSNKCVKKGENGCNWVKMPYPQCGRSIKPAINTSTEYSMSSRATA